MGRTQERARAWMEAGRPWPQLYVLGQLAQLLGLGAYIAVRNTCSALMARMPRPLAFVLGPPLALLAIWAGALAVCTPGALLFRLLLWQPHWLVAALCCAASCAPHALRPRAPCSPALFCVAPSSRALGFVTRWAVLFSSA